MIFKKYFQEMFFAFIVSLLITHAEFLTMKYMYNYQNLN